MGKKKYLWLKQGLDYYENPAIEWLCKQPNGGNFVVLYQRLCILAVKQGGDSIMRHLPEFDELYSIQELATEIKYDVNIVTAGLVFLLQMHLVERREDGSYFIPHLKNMIGRDSDKAKRKQLTDEKLQRRRELTRERTRKWRERKKLEELPSAEKKMLPGSSERFLNAPIPPTVSIPQNGPKRNGKSSKRKGPKPPDFPDFY